jgi:ParB/RepB/Spo0J family partition protein
MAKTGKLVEVVRRPVDENLIPLNEENWEQFLDADGNYMFGADDGAGNVVMDADYAVVTLDPNDVVVETQVDRRTQGSGMTEESITELATSLTDNGQIQPGVVRVFMTPEGEIQYHLLAGMRRTLAARLAGIAMRYMVRVCADEATAAVITDRENMDRENLTVLEIAAQIESALAQTKGNAAQASKLSNIARPTVMGYKKVLDACAADAHFKALWKQGKLSLNAAQELATETDVNVRTKALAKAFQIEAEKAAKIEQAAAVKVAAKVEADIKAGKKPTAPAVPKPAAATKVADKVGGSNSSKVNVSKGAVSGASVKEAIKEVKTGIKALPPDKKYTAKQIIEEIAGEVSEGTYTKPVVLAFSALVHAFQTGADSGPAWQLVRKVINPVYLKPDNVVATSKKVISK